MFLPPLYDKLILSLCHYRLENYSMYRCISSGVVKSIRIASVKIHLIKNPLSSICCCENGGINDKKWIYTYSQALEQHQSPTGGGWYLGEKNINTENENTWNTSKSVPMTAVIVFTTIRFALHNIGYSG